jgi:hypothetical protein
MDEKPVDVSPVEGILFGMPNGAFATDVASRHNTTDFVSHRDLIFAHPAPISRFSREKQGNLLDEIRSRGYLGFELGKMHPRNCPVLAGG